MNLKQVMLDIQTALGQKDIVAVKKITESVLSAIEHDEQEARAHQQFKELYAGH